MVFQKTLARKVDLSGIGVHSGKPVRLTLVPSDRGGIVFRRTDLAGAESSVVLDRMESRNNTTLFGNGFKIQTVEHLLAALYAFGIDTLIVELNADEVPILDGSALPLVQAIEQSGIRILETQRPRLLMRKSFALGDQGATIVVEPAGEEDLLTVSYSIEYSHPGIGNQNLTWTLTPQAFSREIAPARTFGFLKDVDALRSQGLALGASFDNTVVLDDLAVVSGSLRFPDEFVRHKILDIVGDLALLGRSLAGRVTAHKAGHRLHLEAVRFIAENPEFWDEH